jgi:4a-hydroxytetrahydrobiopterin dehydratase
MRFEGASRADVHLIPAHPGVHASRRETGQDSLERIMGKLTRQEIAQELQSLDGWALDGDAIKKTFTFSGFPEAVRFVDRIVPIAEGADHHPDVAINYKRVTLTYSTHSEGGLTEKDFAGAHAVERLA